LHFCDAEKNGSSSRGSGVASANHFARASLLLALEGEEELEEPLEPPSPPLEEVNNKVNEGESEEEEEEEEEEVEQDEYFSESD
jgi:hypothetical protein